MTSPQRAIRQAAPVVAAIAITVDGKTIFANITNVTVGDLPWRISPSHQSRPVPTGSNIGTVIRAFTATVATAPRPSVSVVIASPPKISTSIVSGAPALLSRSVPVPRPPPSSQAKFLLFPYQRLPLAAQLLYTSILLQHAWVNWVTRGLYIFYYITNKAILMWK